MKCSECGRRNKSSDQFCVFCAAQLPSAPKSGNRALMPPQDFFLPLAERRLILPVKTSINLNILLPAIGLIVGLTAAIYYLYYQDTYMVEAVEYYSNINE